MQLLATEFAIKGKLGWGQRYLLQIIFNRLIFSKCAMVFHHFG